MMHPENKIPSLNDRYVLILAYGRLACRAWQRRRPAAYRRPRIPAEMRYDPSFHLSGFADVNLCRSSKPLTARGDSQRVSSPAHGVGAFVSSNVFGELCFRRHGRRHGHSAGDDTTLKCERAIIRFDQAIS